MLLLSGGVHVVCSNMVSYYMSSTCVTHVIYKNSITDVLELVLVEEFN